MRLPHSRLSRALLLCILVFAAPLSAQQAPRTGPSKADSAEASVPRDASGRRILSLASYGEWKRITGAGISPDGAWMTYTYAPLDGDATMHLRELDGTRTHEVPQGTNAAFSDDGAYVAYTIPAARDSNSRSAQQRPAAQNAGSGGNGNRGNTPRTLQIRKLGDGATTDIPGVASFDFAKGSRFLIARRPKAQPDAEHDGADLVIHDLRNNATQVIGSVGAYELNEAGTLLAYTVDAKDRVGNGVFIHDLAGSTTRALRTGALDFSGLSWNDAGTAVAFLEGEKKDGDAQRSNVLVLATSLDARAPRVTVYEPAKDATFPDGYVLSEFSGPQFTKDGGRVFLGIRQQEAAPPKREGAQPNVDVWHWKDDVPQSVQQVRAERTRRETIPAVYNVASGRFVQLGDDDMSSVQRATNGGRYGVGRLDAPYRGEVSWGGSRADWHRVDLDTGERTPIVSGVMRTHGLSPDGMWFVHVADGDVVATNLTSMQAVNLSERAGVSFIDVDDDHDYEKPTWGLAGWSADGRHVLLNHRYDIWAVPLTAGAARNLTGGAGDADRIRFRIVSFDDDDDDAGVALDRPILLSGFGDRTKKSGYFELRPGAKPQPIVWEDRAIGSVQKAANADRIIYTAQTFTEFPDYWVSDTRFASPRRVTDANPQLAEYAWSPGRVLIDYTDARGNQLQGTLALPANYEPGKRYPMLVYFYEKMSDQHHRFSMPAYDDRPHMSTYASDGYLVLQPDVVYTIGRPGTSALDDVTSAVKKVIELGYADPERIGLQGHSWGGYQSSYIVTQTDMFAAVVTGAPVTNLVSFYNELYKSSGSVQQGIMEVGQVRMGQDSTPWSAHALYESQSPLHNAEKITTPFLILHGTADGAVDYHQGLEYFNAARRLGKEVILLSYPDEPHHLAKRPNQEDFQVRMKQYFDHYLKGTPAPPWMTDGVPFIRKDIDRPGAAPVTTAARSGG